MALPLPTQFRPDCFIEGERRDQPNESDDLQQNAENNGEMFVNRSDSVNALKYGKGRRTDEWCQEKQEESVIYFEIKNLKKEIARLTHSNEFLVTEIEDTKAGKITPGFSKQIQKRSNRND